MENLKAAAKKIQEKGTGGDTILAHINPHEAMMLKVMGGSGTTNPETGLPEYKKFWKNITAKAILQAAPIILAVAAPGIGSAIGSAITGAAVAGATEAAIGAAIMSGGRAAVQGKSPEDIAKAAAAGGVGSLVGGTVGSEVASTGAPQAVSSALGQSAGSATSAAITGGDVGKSAATGAIIGGAGGAYKDLTAPDVAQGISPTASGETGLKAPSGFDASQLGVSGDTTQTAGGGITAPTQFAGYSLAPAAKEPSFIQQAGEQATKYLAQEAASKLYPTKSSTADTSALSSTGLFSPTSIVPTTITGIAPTARGKPILGSEDEEATGAWGAKTLRG